MVTEISELEKDKVGLTLGHYDSQGLTDFGTRMYALQELQRKEQVTARFGYPIGVYLGYNIPRYWIPLQTRQEIADHVRDNSKGAWLYIELGKEAADEVLAQEVFTIHRHKEFE